MALDRTERQPSAPCTHCDKRTRWQRRRGTCVGGSARPKCTSAPFRFTRIKASHLSAPLATRSRLVPVTSPAPPTLLLGPVGWLESLVGVQCLARGRDCGKRAG